MISSNVLKLAQSAMSKLSQAELEAVATYFTSTSDNSKARNNFSKNEDQTLYVLVEKFGEDWNKIASMMGQRTPRQCRERFRHYLSPNLNNGAWTQSEDELLLNLVKMLGTHWTQISQSFPGRTDFNVKNRWLVLIRKKSSISKDVRQLQMKENQTTLPTRVVEPIFPTNYQFEEDSFLSNFGTEIDIPTWN